MKANELRIGNWINDNGYNSIIGVIDSHYHAIQISGSPRMIALETIEPIPLTEEWLPRLGFPKDRDTMNLLFDYIIYFERQQNSLYLCNNQTKVQYVIEWVHEAQNLYFALTGEELTIS